MGRTRIYNMNGTKINKTVRFLRIGKLQTPYGDRFVPELKLLYSIRMRIGAGTAEEFGQTIVNLVKFRIYRHKVEFT